MPAKAVRDVPIAQVDDLAFSAVPGLIERLGLLELQDKPLYMLSTGSRRKVWLVAITLDLIPVKLADRQRGSAPFNLNPAVTPLLAGRQGA